MRRHLMLAGGVALVAVLFAAHVAVGRGSLGLAAVLQTLAGQPPSATAALIVGELRLPRALLGLSGAVLQSVVRNPLAEPGLLGVTAGAVFAAVCYLAFVPATYLAFGQGIGQDGGPVLPLVTVFGGLATGALVWAVARRGGSDPLRIVLVGVVVAAVVAAATSLVLLLYNEAVGGITLWLVGSLNGRTWLHWGVLWPWAIVALVGGLGCVALLNALALGDDIAAGLGLRVQLVRGLLLAANGRERPTPSPSGSSSSRADSRTLGRCGCCAGKTMRPSTRHWS